MASKPKRKVKSPEDRTIKPNNPHKGIYRPAGGKLWDELEKESNRNLGPNRGLNRKRQG